MQRGHTMTSNVFVVVQSTDEYRQTATELTPPELIGDFRVQRTAGLLPPLHFSKRIGANGHGRTSVLGLPLFPFRVSRVTAPFAACVLRYTALPIQDELQLTDAGWVGRGLVFGREFCRFRLIRSA